MLITKQVFDVNVLKLGTAVAFTEDSKTEKNGIVIRITPINVLLQYYDDGKNSTTNVNIDVDDIVNKKATIRVLK